MALRARLTPQPPASTPRWAWHTPKWSSVRASRLFAGDRRMEGELYLSSGTGLRIAVEDKPSGWVRFGEMARAWAPPRIKTVLVSPQNGVPYLNTSQVFDVRPAPRKWLALSKTSKAESRLAAEGTILVMASASVGRTTITTTAHENSFISHHFMRVEPFDPAMKGWVYAFLQSPQGQAMMSSSQYASVIRHIEPHHLSALPVPEVAPSVSMQFQSMLDELISLRNEASRLANEADKRYANAIGPIAPHPKCEGFSVPASGMVHGRRRLEAAYYNPDATAILSTLPKWERLRDLSERVWWMSRFKRFYGPQGIPYLSADELFTINPPGNKRILVRPDDDHEDYFASRGWIVMACSGQVYGLNGAAALMTEHHENKFLSHDLIRIIPDKAKIRAGYLLIALTHRTHGRPLLIRAAYGTSIPHLDPGDVAEFPVARLAPSEEDAIADLAEACAECRAKADLLEQDIAREAGKVIGEFLHRPAIRLVSNEPDDPAGEFESMAKRWREERPRGADVAEMVDTPAYRAIIAMGKSAVGPILRQLKQRADHWFYALHQITGENPVLPEEEGKLKQMADAWLRWGRERGYIGELD